MSAVPLAGDRCPVVALDLAHRYAEDFGDDPGQDRGRPVLGWSHRTGARVDDLVPPDKGIEEARNRQRGGVPPAGRSRVVRRMSGDERDRAVVVAGGVAQRAGQVWSSVVQPFVVLAIIRGGVVDDQSPVVRNEPVTAAEAAIGLVDGDAELPCFWLSRPRTEGRFAKLLSAQASAGRGRRRWCRTALRLGGRHQPDDL